MIAGEAIGVTVGDKQYQVIVQPGDEPLNMVDRFVFEIAQDPHPLVIAQRDISQVETLVFTARTAGDVANGIPMSVQIPTGSPTRQHEDRQGIIATIDDVTQHRPANLAGKHDHILPVKYWFDG